MDWICMLDNSITVLLTIFSVYSFSCRKIRPCPSINPGCISSNPKSSSFAFPWLIPENSKNDAIQVSKAFLKKSKLSYIFIISILNVYNFLGMLVCM